MVTIRNKETNKYMQVHPVDAAEITRISPDLYEIIPQEIMDEYSRQEKVKELVKEKKSIESRDRINTTREKYKGKKQEDEKVDEEKQEDEIKEENT